MLQACTSFSLSHTFQTAMATGARGTLSAQLHFDVRLLRVWQASSPLTEAMHVVIDADIEVRTELSTVLAMLPGGLPSPPLLGTQAHVHAHTHACTHAHAVCHCVMRDGYGVWVAMQALLTCRVKVCTCIFTQHHLALACSAEVQQQG